VTVGIVGGGIAGLSAAYELTRKGTEVILVERESQLGGQAATFPVEGTRLERYYHHIFTSDDYVQALIEELGLGSHLEWIESQVGTFYQGQIYDFVTPMDLLRFKPLPFVDRIRLGLATLYLQRFDDWGKLEHITAREWIHKYAGKNAYDVVWGPLLRGKFGARADEVSMTWLWGKIRLRVGSRRGVGREKLGYMQGSFQKLLDSLERSIRSRGGQILTGAEVKRIATQNGRVSAMELKDGRSFPCRQVMATVPSPLFIEMAPDLGEEYTRLLRGVSYQGVICLVLKLNRPLSHIYWLNISDPHIPFVGAIEHTNYVSSQNYGGYHILYLTNYLENDDPLFSLSKDELLRRYLPGLQRLYGEYSSDWVEDSWLFRDEAGQPVITRGYSQRIPEFKTPVEGLYLANTTQIYPQDRGMNYSVWLGQQVSQLALQDE
jgi:protoporphyrinogen oxidase